MRMKPSILLALLLCAGCADSLRTIESRKELDECYESASRRMEQRRAAQFTKLLQAYIDCQSRVITNTVFVTVTNCPDQQPRWMLPAPMPNGWPTNALYYTNFYVTDPVNVEAQ